MAHQRWVSDGPSLSNGGSKPRAFTNTQAASKKGDPIDFWKFTSRITGGTFTPVLFSLGIMPYITASIIFSLLVKVFPRLESLSKEGELGDLWRESGLQSVEERPLEIDQAFATFEDYWAPFLGGQGPAGGYVRALTDAGRARLEERLRTRLMPENDGPFTLRARAWAARGVVK